MLQKMLLSLFVILLQSATAYRNPLLNKDAPDPGCIYDPSSNSFFCAHTGSNDDGVFPIYQSADVAGPYSYVSTALDNSNSWTVDRYWAPEIHLLPSGKKYVLMYTGGNSNNVLCLGVATSSSPAGPYEPSQQPLLCNDDASNPTVALRSR